MKRKGIYFKERKNAKHSSQDNLRSDFLVVLGNFDNAEEPKVLPKIIAKRFSCSIGNFDNAEEPKVLPKIICEADFFVY